MKGTNGWKWHVVFSDPEVGGFELSSSINGGAKRLVVEDTKNDGHYWGDFEYVLNKLQGWPRDIANGKQCDVLYESNGFAKLCITSPVFSKLAKKAAEADTDALEYERDSIWGLFE